MKNFLRISLATAALLASTLVHAATVYIEEFARNTNVQYQSGYMPSLTHQTVVIGGSSTQSAAFSTGTYLIRVEVDATCSIQIGTTNPTATTTSMRFVAGQTEYFLVQPGDKLAVITNT